MYENFQQTIERAQNYPLYSQDEQRQYAKCISVLHIGNIRWYILEGQQEGNDFILFGIVCGMVATEYGYISLNELSQIEIHRNGCTFKVQEIPGYLPLSLNTLASIDNELSDFLHSLYDKENEN